MRGISLRNRKRTKGQYRASRNPRRIKLYARPTEHTGAYPINTQVVTRNNKDDGRTCFGIGENGDPGYTLQAAHSHGVIYAIDRAAFNQGENALYDFQINDNEINSTIVAKGPSAVLDTRLSVWVVRRLTPTECERLQGFPDDWTKYDTYGIQIKDTPRYAALGNSIAIPCALRVFEGIIDVDAEVTK